MLLKLKAEAPLAYNHIEGTRDKNLQTAQTVEAQDEVNRSTSPANTSQPEGISGEVRAPPESRVIESVQPATVGRVSEASAGSEPADTGMARPEQDGTRERERRDVQEREVTSEHPRRKSSIPYLIYSICVAYKKSACFVLGEDTVCGFFEKKSDPS